MFPKSIKIGTSRYVVHRRQRKRKPLGTVSYTLKTITINERGHPAEDRNTFWHETVHAILYEMGHPLYADEKFVTKFSTTLSRAIDSARF